MLIEEHLDKAVDARQRGRLKAPKPPFKEKSTTWATLLQAKEEESIAVGTLAGMTKAVERLEGWVKVNYSLHLPGTLDGDVAKKFRSWLSSSDSGLKLKRRQGIPISQQSVQRRSKGGAF